MTKTPRSFSIEEDIDEALRRRDDLNASGAVNKFLHEYVRSGKGEEAALSVRLEQLDEEIADKETELDRLRRERDRIEAELESRRSELREQVSELEGMVREGAFPRENITAENEAIRTRASEAGVPPTRLVSELEGRL